MLKNGSTLTIIIGLLLICIGVLSRVLTGTSSITALIPAFFGVPIAIMGWLSMRPKQTRWSMVVACILALLGIFGTYSVIETVLQGSPLSAPAIARGLMLVLCIIQVAISANTFLQTTRSA